MKATACRGFSVFSGRILLGHPVVDPLPAVTPFAWSLPS
jgi:hypothetical protein